MKSDDFRRLETAGTTDEAATNQQLLCDGGQTNPKTFRQRMAERVSDYLEGASQPNELPETFDDIADWNSGSEGIEGAKFTFNDDHIQLQYDLDVEDCIVEVHSFRGDVMVVIDEDGDHWRDVVVNVSPDEAERMAEQLELAAKFARQEVNADVRT